MDIEVLKNLPQLSKIIYKSEAVHLYKLDSSYRKKHGCRSEYMLVYKYMSKKNVLVWPLNENNDLEKKLIELGFKYGYYISVSSLLHPDITLYDDPHPLNKYLSIIELELI